MVKIKFFNAKWCGPCKAMKPGIDEMKKKGYPIEEIDIDDNGTLAESVSVRGVPTIIIYENNVEMERVVGFEDVSKLEKRFNIYIEPK